jgi:hypothetical protein
MEMVAAVVRRPQPQGAGRVPHREVEVDHAVQFLAGADPVVDRLALGILLQRIVARALERHQRAADHGDAPRMGARDQLPIAGNQVGGRDRRR